MISLLCQKSNDGIIKSENSDLFNYIFNGEQQIGNRDVSSARYNYNTELDSAFLKKFPTISRFEENRSATPTIEAKLNSDIVSNPVIINNTNNKYKLNRSSTAKEKHSPLSSKTSSACSDKYPEKPKIKEKQQFLSKRFHSKKLQNIQLWLDQNLNKNSSNLDIYRNLNELLTKERELSEDINRDLEEFTINEYRKKELVYKNWYLNVYEPIQKEITKNINENGEFAREMRNTKYVEYLNQVNRHGCAFRDDYEREDYDPTNIVQLDANLPKKLRDPTNLPLRKTHNEDKTVIRCINGRMLSAKETEATKLPIILNDNESRSDIDWNSWVLKQYSNIESTARARSSLKCKPGRHTSEFNLDWNRDKNENQFLSSNSVYMDHTKNLNINTNNQKDKV